MKLDIFEFLILKQTTKPLETKLDPKDRKNTERTKHRQKERTTERTNKWTSERKINKTKNTEHS